MQITRQIERPIPGEQVLKVVPPLAPYTAADAAALTRARFFTNRPLTHLALTAEQRARMTALAAAGQALAPGVIAGLELSFERAAEPGDDALILRPGRALAPSGEDVELAYTLRVDVDLVPIHPAGLRLASDEDDDLRALIRAESDITLGLLREKNRLDRVPHAMVLTAVPITLLIDTSDTGTSDTPLIDATGLGSPCPNATGDDAASEQSWEDGMQLRWVPWPQDKSLPGWSSGDGKLDPKFRNRLAYAIFNNERDRTSLIDRVRALGQQRVNAKPEQQRELDARIRELRARARTWPWEDIGVALSVAGFDADMRIAFADRGAVVRQGGGRRNRSALVPLAGDDVLWQARVAQLVEHLAEHVAEMPADALPQDELAALFDWLPPAGILPKQMIDVAAGRQLIFPANFDVQAQPVPIDMVDALIAESAPLAPFNLSLRDQIQVLVPVPARFFEPDLLKLDERIHPLFDAEVARLENARLGLVVQRDGLRRRFEILSKAVSGAWLSYPEDDPEALPDETGALDAMAFTRVHFSAFKEGQIGAHEFRNTSAPLALDAADELFVFVRWDQRPARVQLKLHSAGREQPLTVYWGAAEGAAAGALSAGSLPEVDDVWLRLSVPVSALQLGGDQLLGVEYSVAGQAAGRLAWGYLGKIASGREAYWVTDALPPGSTMTVAASWSWLEQDPRIDDNDRALGVPIVSFTRRVSEVDNLVASYRAYRGGLLAVELGDAPAEPNAARTPHPLDAGLDELIRRLEGRIQAGNDHVEFGFLRARTDIFRIRQSVLGTEEAGRLLTSPVAAELIQRSENQVATEKQFAEYFARARTQNVSAAEPGGGPAPSGAIRGPARAARAPAAAIRSAPLSDAIGSSLSRTSPVKPSVPIADTRIAEKGELRSTLTRAGAGAAAELLAKEETGIARELILGGTGGKVAATAAAAAAPEPTVEDVVGTSLLGASLDTVTVGQRLQTPPAILAHNAATNAKKDFVLEGIDILKSGGLAIDDVPLSGFVKNGDKPVNTVKDLNGVARADVGDKDLIADQDTDRHEAEYFKHSLDAVDNMVRFLRHVEIRVEDYRRLQNDARSARERIIGVLTRLEGEIAALGGRLAEVRHDLSVARALRSEEEQRVRSLIARRTEILAQQVPYLVFRRPRLARTLTDVPVRNVEPAVIENLVPRCRGETHDIPPELQQMVDTLKDVPARWFARIHPLVFRFDDLDKLGGLVAFARERLGRSEVRKVTLGYGMETKTGGALAAAFERHEVRMLKSMQDAQALAREQRVESWKEAAGMARKLIAVGDLIRAPRATREITLAVAGELDDIAGVAACLYASFSQVPPVARLRWAERFSQFDAPADLRLLTVLPGFGDEKLGVDYIQWKQMQAMVDWLFSRIEPEDDAIAAINDLVRVCLLLASHAPVKRIISARIRKPVIPAIDVRLDLELDPKIARIGMQVLVHSPAGAGIAARAVVEDISANGGLARITEVLAPNVVLDSSTRVQLQSGPPLSMPAARGSR